MILGRIGRRRMLPYTALFLLFNASVTAAGCESGLGAAVSKGSPKSIRVATPSLLGFDASLEVDRFLFLC